MASPKFEQPTIRSNMGAQGPTLDDVPCFCRRCSPRGRFWRSQANLADRLGTSKSASRPIPAPGKLHIVQIRSQDAQFRANLWQINTEARNR